MNVTVAQVVERRFHKPQGVSASLTSDTMGYPSEEYTKERMEYLSFQLNDLLLKLVGGALVSVGVSDEKGYWEFVVYVRKLRSLGFMPDDYMGVPIRVIRVSSINP